MNFYLKMAKIGLFILLAISFLSWFFIGRQIAARIGSHTIYKKDVEYRDQIIHLEYPEYQESAGLKQLMKSYTYLQIMENWKYEPIQERLKIESSRIESTTKNPARLQEVKNIFKTDVAAYERDFVYPAAIDEVVTMDFYPSLETVHSLAQKKADNLLEDCQKNPDKEFSEIAKAHSLIPALLVVSLKDGIYPMDLQKVIERGHRRPKIKMEKQPQPMDGKKLSMENSGEDPFARIWINIILKDLKPREYALKPVNSGDFLSIVRFIRVLGKNEYLIESVTIPKKNFDQWIEEESKKISIRTGPFLF